MLARQDKEDDDDSFDPNDPHSKRTMSFSISDVGFHDPACMCFFIFYTLYFVYFCFVL